MVLEQDSTRETDTDGEQRTHHTVFTGTKIRRAKAKSAPEEMSWDSLTQPFQEANAEFTSTLKEPKVEAPAELAAPIDSQQPAAPPPEQVQAKVPPKPEVPVEEVDAPEPAEPVEEEVTEAPAPEVPPKPAPEKIPMPPAEEVLPWIREIEAARQQVAKRLHTPQLIAKAFITGKHQLMVNPVIRKAFIIHLSETLGVSHPQLEADLLAPVEDLMDAPVDYLGELLEQFRDPAAEPPSWDSKAQRERDVARLESTISETIDELVKVFGENQEAWEELRGHLEISPEAPVTDTLFEMVLKTPSKILGAFESLQLGSATLQAFLKGNQMTQLQHRLSGLRKKLELVRQGILINPST